MAEVYHALGLHTHQPPGNLVALHNSGERWEAKQMPSGTAVHFRVSNESAKSD